jgi:hypothetical protein
MLDPIKINKINKNKALIFIGLIVCLISIVVLKLINSATPAPTTTQSTTSTPLPTSKLQTVPNDSPITFKYNTAAPIIPDFYEEFKIEPAARISKDDSLAIAKSLNFSGEPEVVIPDQDRTIFFWNEPQKALTIEAYPPSVSYSIDGKPTSPPTNSQEAIEKIKSFLTNHQLLNPQFSLSSAKISYLHSEGGSFVTVQNPKDADQMLVHFEYLLDNKLLYINELNRNSVTATMGDNSEIFSIQAQLPPKIGQSTKAKPLTINEIQSEIDQNRGYLISSSNEGYINFAYNPLIEVASIDKIELVYVLFSNEYKIKPMYKLSATATDKNNGRASNIEYLIRAAND